MTMVLDTGRNIKLMTTLTLCLIPLKNSRYKIYIWVSELNNSTKYLVEVKGGYSEQKEDKQNTKIACKGYKAACFGEVCNSRGNMVA